MSFKARYEFDVSAHKSWRDPHIVICCEGMPHNDGEGSLRFWLETRIPESWDFDKNEGVPAHTITSESATVYSYSIVYKRSGRGGEYYKADAKWHLREMIIALANGDVGGKSAGSMIYHVFAYTVMKQEPKWLTEGAPEWWSLIRGIFKQEKNDAAA